MVDAYCPDSDGLTRLLMLSWFLNDEQFNITFNFTVKSTQWYLGQVLFDFELDENNFDSPWPDSTYVLDLFSFFFWDPCSD